jgi:hypothetical protein
MEAGDVALQPPHRQGDVIGMTSLDDQASSSPSSERTLVARAVTPAIGEDGSLSTSPSQTTEAHQEVRAEQRQCPLNFTQTVFALVALVLMAYLVQPQLADHALNKWSAAKDFRDDCRAQEVSI